MPRQRVFITEGTKCRTMEKANRLAVANSLGGKREKREMLKAVTELPDYLSSEICPHIPTYTTHFRTHTVSSVLKVGFSWK